MFDSIYFILAGKLTSTTYTENILPIPGSLPGITLRDSFSGSRLESFSCLPSVPCARKDNFRLFGIISYFFLDTAMPHVITWTRTMLSKRWLANQMEFRNSAPRNQIWYSHWIKISIYGSSNYLYSSCHAYCILS